MPAGLQAWDASGNLIVDLGDYTVKFVGKYTITFPKGQNVSSFAVNGINGNNSFAAITATDSSGGLGFIQFYAKTKTNGVDVIYLPTGNTLYAEKLTIEVYQFI
ncbi:hypothetical protein [Escherichia phage vB_EcoS_PHB17]|uniref:Uncharacterized protein n=1 Tax=Escherichia phage vB_EcoS_PHB17 TaxID=2591407 RepID=A0A514DKS3_9CAUD|nr:hypothetical protein KMB84_gp52 [Escherichia phage vB_EcoS_PHB17]QDH94255.1 hypothetical protein [Escherichia phage vB_EcoS_PHB17]